MMSLKIRVLEDVPESTAQIARAAFPKGNIYLQLRDKLGTIYEDQQFKDLYAHDGQSAVSPWRLALITVLQFAENMPDRQAADAVRGRIDWKYLLGLEITDAGFDYSILCEFRARLVTGGADILLLERMIEIFKNEGVLKSRKQQRTDSTHILTAVRDLSRLELVGKTMLHVLNSLAIVSPTWLKTIAPMEWEKRYLIGWEDYHLPKSKAKRLELGEQVVQDGIQLLEAVFEKTAPAWICEMPAVDILRQVWVQNFYEDENGLHWRESGNIPPASRMICSPFDLEARYNTKRHHHWVGYKVHLTEICTPEDPHLITHVITTEATRQDVEVVSELHEELAEKDLLPDQHLLDRGYSASHTILEADEKYGVEMITPTRSGNGWQQQSEEAYDLSRFQIDWANQRAICPQGKESGAWVIGKDRMGDLRYEMTFSTSDCAPCPTRALCTNSKRKRRKITVRPRKQHEILQRRREFEQTDEFKNRYADRAGIEGTISQAVHALKIRRSRYRGLEKTHLQHIATAAAINLKRLHAWWNDHPLSQTTSCPFAILMST